LQQRQINVESQGTVVQGIFSEELAKGKGQQTVLHLAGAYFRGGVEVTGLDCAILQDQLENFGGGRRTVARYRLKGIAGVQGKGDECTGPQCPEGWSKELFAPPGGTRSVQRALSVEENWSRIQRTFRVTKRREKKNYHHYSRESGGVEFQPDNKKKYSMGKKACTTALWVR